MGENRYVIDQLTYTVRKAGINVGRLIRKVVSVLLAAISLTIVAYCIFAFFFSTDKERSLKRQNRMYEKVYPMLQPKEELLLDGISLLQSKDATIYGQVFHSTVPNPDPAGGVNGTFGSDTVPDTKMVAYAAAKSDRLVCSADSIEAAFSRIFRIMADSAFVAPPLDMPVKDVSYTQIGASTGWKVSPFFKTYVRHDGLDIIAPQGTPVLAAADGVVSGVRRSVKGDGNQIVIDHGGGYTTTYSHLLDVDVRRGMAVSRGQRIGTVGMTGSSYSPHLHYEVAKEGKQLNPVNHILASVTPEEYSNMLYMAENTEQSMD